MTLNALKRYCTQLAAAGLLACLTLLVPSALAAGLSSFNRSAFLEANAEDDILPPDEAFKASVQRIDEKTLHADFRIAPGHYLYRDRFKFELTPSSDTKLDVTLPKGESKDDPTFGKTEVFHNETTAIVTLAQIPTGSRLQMTYQGCSEKGLCYSPIRKVFDIPAYQGGSDPTYQGQLAADDHDAATRLLKDGNLWLVIAGFFGLGLLLSLTPCVLPMIPILSSIIVGAKPGRKLQGFLLSLAYVLGMALAYSMAGVAAAYSGQLLSSALQTAPVLVVTALLFVALALSMFGFYELRLPATWQDRILGISSRLKGGQLLGVFLMGAISALIVSPCVAAPLAGALVYISQTHDLLLGGSALFALSIGMGIPLLLIGTSVGSLLPKAGPWMNSVRYAFGVLLLAVAVWLVAPLLPVSVEIALWAALLIVPAIFMRALDRLPDNASGWMRFWKALGLIMLLLGLLLMIGAVSGAKSPLRPLSGLRADSHSQPTILAFQRIKTSEDLDRSIAVSSGKVVMLDFYADWCVACKEMERFTFSDPQVRERLKDVVLLQADVTVNDADDQALLKRFGLFGPPGIIFFDRDGHENATRVIGYQNSDRFLASLSKVGI